MKSSTKYWKILINYVMMAMLIVVLLYVVPKLIVYFMPFVIAWIIALITNPLVRFLENRIKIKRKAGSVVVIVLALALVVGVCYWAVYVIVTQLNGLIANAPRIWESISNALSLISSRINHVFARIPSAFKIKTVDIGDTLYESFSNGVSNIGEELAASASDSVKNLPLTIIGIIMGVLASYTFVARNDEIAEFRDKILSESAAQRIRLVTDTMKNAVGGYFRAQFKIMGFVFIVLVIGFMILGIDYSVLIALLVAILDFLPFFGTGTVMIPWAVIGLVQRNYKLGIGLLIVWGASQLVRQLIQPKVLGDTVGMPPIPTLFLLYIGFRMGGAIGLIIAVPIGMILYNLYKAGVFSNFIYSTRILIKDVKQFRVFSEEELKAEGISMSTTGSGSEEETDNH